MRAPEAMAISKDPKANEQKKKVWKAAALYLDARSRLHGDVVGLTYRLYALQDERALALAETNALQWQALIDVNVDQLAAYGKSGVKAKTVSALLNSLTLLWIGHGVQ